VFRCAGCGRPVHGTDGYVEVDTGAAGERVRYFEALRLERAKKADGRLMAVPLGEVLEEVLAAPPVAPWIAWHRKCDPAPGSSTYWIGTERIATWPAVVDWTAHLAEKRWIRGTDWFAMLRNLAHEEAAA
jgi:hypothetical protein